MRELYLKYYLVSPIVWAELAIGSVLQSVFVLAVVYQAHQVINKEIPKGDLQGLLLSLLIILGATCFISAVSFYLQKRVLKLVERSSLSFREYLADRCLQFSKSFMSKTPVSTIQHTLVQDTVKIDEASLAFLDDIIPSAFNTVAINIALLFLNWKLYLVLISTAPVLLLISRGMNKQLSLSIQKHQQGVHAFGDYVLHLLQTLDLIHTQAAAPMERELQREKIGQMQRDFVRANEQKAIYLTVQNLVVTLSALLILGVGGYSVITGSMTLGSLIAFYVGVGIQKRYLISLTSAYEKILTGIEAFKHLFSIYSTTELHPYSGEKKIPFTGAITLCNLSFSFGELSLLKNFSLDLQPGKLHVMVGPNGSGKTTLINLILGFYRSSRGKLLADGVPYDEIDLEALRKQIGVVAQTPILRTGTIGENIAFGFPEATFEEIEKVAELSSAAKFIEELPHGYETDIGSYGLKLSGGERQRVAIARALMGEPKLLILDEPTNHLDRESVEILIERILKLPHAPAILCITHDVNLIQYSDHVQEVACG